VAPLTHLLKQVRRAPELIAAGRHTPAFKQLIITLS